MCFSIAVRAASLLRSTASGSGAREAGLALLAQSGTAARRSRSLFFALAAALLLAGGFGEAIVLHAQGAGAAGPVIRAETRVVLIDAAVTDKKGKFDRDLTEKDFKVWEDGREQKITGFSLESSGVLPERPGKHYIAMFFDTATTGQSAQMSIRQESMRFVDGFASPDRYMAIVSYNLDGGLRVAQNFTTDAGLLKKALNTLQASSNGASDVAAQPAPARGGRRGGGRGAEAAPSPNAFAYHNMLESLRSLADSLATIRGRKALILFSSGVPATDDLLSDLKATIEACNKANVAVYAVGASLAGNADEDGPDSVSAAPAAGRTPRNVRVSETDPGDEESNLPLLLSEGTGGIAFLTSNDLAASLGKVAHEQDDYYLLSYTPAVDSPEGSCHNLKVKVDRGNLEVRARKSYCTSKPVDLLSGKPEGKDLETRAAGSAPGDIAAKMQLPWFYTAPNVARVNLAMDIIPSAAKFRKEKGKFHSEFDLDGVAYKTDGTAAAHVSDAVKLDFDNRQQVDAFLRAPYHYENQFDIAPGQYDFRLAFTAGGEDFGKVEMPLKIDPWNGQTLSASGLALSHEAHRAADLAAGLDVSLLEGVRPLVAKGTEVVPAGSPDFRAGEPGFFYLEAYEPLLTAAKPDAPLPLIGMRVRVLDRATGKQISDSGVKIAAGFERPGNPVVPIVSSLPLANLPIGAYKLEVSVMRQTGKPVVRTADFNVN